MRAPATSYSCHSERSEESTFADPSASPRDDTKTTVSSGTHPMNEGAHLNLKNSKLIFVEARRAAPLQKEMLAFIVFRSNTIKQLDKASRRL